MSIMSTRETKCLICDVKDLYKSFINELSIIINEKCK